jgi:hypothetical protein
MAQTTQPGQTAAVSAQAAGIALSCRPDRSGNRLIFPYTVTNHGAAEVYVMDAVPAVDPVSHQAIVDHHAAAVWLGGDGFAHVLRGMPPLPDDKDVLGHVIPFAVRLAPGATLERSLEVPLPLAETSPYYGDLPLRDYELIDIQGVTLIVEFLRGTVEGFRAEPASNAPDLFNISSRNLLGQIERVVCAFPSRQLQILKRPGDFPRPN